MGYWDNQNNQEADLEAVLSYCELAAYLDEGHPYVCGDIAGVGGGVGGHLAGAGVRR